MSCWELLPRTRNPNGTLKHIRKEGSRYHILLYDSKGRHCSEPECEVNKRNEERRMNK